MKAVYCNYAIEDLIVVAKHFSKDKIVRKFNKNVSVFFFAFFCFPIYALECPDQAYVVKVDLGEKLLSFCQVNNNGQIVKHGPEEYTDRNGKVLETKYYKFGVEGKPEFSHVGLPGISEKHETFLNSNVAIDTVKSLLQAMLPFFDKKSLNKDFLVHGCPDYRAKWVKILVFKTPHELVYSLGEKCHISGKITYDPKNEFYFNLDLKNMHPFTHVNMHLKCAAGMSKMPLIDLDCSTQDGILFEKGNGNTFFTLNYALTIDPQIKNLVHENKGGKVIFSKIFGKQENLESDLLINISKL